jgi:hypothetical protein
MLKDVKFNKNILTGKIDSSKSGILFLSIPYSDKFKIYVDDKISNLNLNTNLNNYATKTYVKQLITNSETKINVSLNNYATKTYVAQEISKIQNNNGVTPEDLSNYVSKSELEKANYVSYNKFELLQEEINTLKQIVEDLKNNSTTPPKDPEQPEPPEEPEIIYGNIIISASSLIINEGNTSNFTVKLDKAPTQQQIVNISVNNNNVRIDKTNLTFTSDNYNVAQTITVTGVHDSKDYSNKTAIITINSNNVSNKTISVTINNIDIESTTHNMLYTIPNGITIDNKPSTVENNSS